MSNKLQRNLQKIKQKEQILVCSPCFYLSKMSKSSILKISMEKGLMSLPC
jgi:hypothetical protein